MDAPVPEQADKSWVIANEEANLGLEGMRADVNDPRGYGNSFVWLWHWVRRKLKGKS